MGSEVYDLESGSGGVVEVLVKPFLAGKTGLLVDMGFFWVYGDCFDFAMVLQGSLADVFHKKFQPVQSWSLGMNLSRVLGLC